MSRSQYTLGAQKGALRKKERTRLRDWKKVGRDYRNNAPIRTLGTRKAESKDLQNAQARGPLEEGSPPPAPARAPFPLPANTSGGGLFGARAPAHLPGSAPRPTARSRPRAEATQSRSTRALRAHLPHPSHRPGRPPAGLRWRRRQRQGKRWPRAESAGGATAARLRIPGPRSGSRRDHGFLGLLPARSGLEGTRLHVLLDLPFCRLRLALPSAAAAILCPGPGLRAAHALVPPLRDLAAAAPPS
ncbi:unnamed protein product [Nyctereutes procyonoides]|uniref:(raccoon dog) hypothetical protein n=1 Tax=Nyctereutes procyonoides TaxID=34880 RepID=A0A811XV97_NYCPR|nr:unnamed protein product [Nyctereutes procyonoides]